MKKSLIVLMSLISCLMFVGCDKKEEPKEEDKKFVVTFESNGGSTVESIEVKCGETLKLPVAPTKEEHKFITWQDKNETPIYDDALLTCEDVTLYAKWEKNEFFTVTFDSRGGDEVGTVRVKCGDVLRLPEEPTKLGYIFTTWEDKNETPIYNDALLTCDDVTLYAKWVEL